MLTLPSFLFGLLISSLYASAFHLWKGGGLGRLVLYILLSWGGFFLGHFIATRMGISLASLGPLRVGAATVGSLLFLFIGHWLSLIQLEENPS